MNKIKTAAGIMIVFLNNFILLDFYLYPLLYDESGYSLPYYFIVSCIMTLVLYVLTPKITFNPIKKVRRSIFLKIILTIYLLIIAIMTTTFASIALSSIFYEGRTFIPFLSILIICPIYFFKIKLPIIVNTAFLFFIGAIGFLIYNTASHVSLLDFDSILLFSPKNINLKGILMMLFIVLDSYLYILIIPMLEHRGKKAILIGTILYFIMELIESSILLLMLGVSLDKFYGFGYFLYSIESIIGVIGNLDFVYIYLITIAALVKIVICLNMIKLFNFEKQKIVMPVIISALALTSFLFARNYYMLDNKVYILIIILMVVPIIFIFYLWRWYFENKRLN